MRLNRMAFVVVLGSAILAACGGGGGDSAEPPADYTPPPPPASTAPTQAQTTLTDGLLTLSGMGTIVNGVEQTAVSITAATAASSGVFNLSATVIAGPTGATPVSAFDTLDSAAYFTLSQNGWTTAPFAYQAQFTIGEDAVVSVGSVATAPFTWSMKLNLQDVGGQPADKYLNDAAGAPLLSSYAAANLPTGTLAAYPSFAPSVSTVIASLFGDMDPLIATEADLLTRTFCEPTPTGNARIQYQLATNGVLKVWDATAGCGAPAVSIADGQWQSQTLYGKTIYALTFPDAAQYDRFSAYVPSSAFTAGAKRVIVAGTSGERWKMGYFIPRGAAIQSQRPFLTSAALQAVRAAASL